MVCKKQSLLMYDVMLCRNWEKKRKIKKESTGEEEEEKKVGITIYHPQ